MFRSLQPKTKKPFGDAVKRLASGERKQSHQDDAHQIFQFLVANNTEAVFWTDERGRFIGCNDSTCKLLGYSLLELKQLHVSNLDLSETETSRKALLEQLSSQPYVTAQCQPRRKDGTHVTMEFKTSRLVIEDRFYICTYLREIDLEKQLRDRVLKALATGIPLDEILGLIVELAQKTRIGMLGSILLLDETGRLRNGAATELPESYCEQIDGTEPGPCVGSCGTAAFRGTSVMVTDISQSPLWSEAKDLAASAGLQACWSEPIFSTRNEVVGTLAMYFREPQVPTQLDKELMSTFAHMAGIAIERVREHERLSKSELRNRSLVNSSVATLWTTSAQGEFVSNQESWEAYTGQAWIAHRGLGWAKMLHPDDRDRIATEWKKAVNSPRLFQSHGRLWHASSSDYRYFEVNATPILNNNRIVEWVGSTTDVHDRTITKNSLIRSQAILAQVQEVARLGSWVWDFESDLIEWTDEFCRLHGFDSDHRSGDFKALMKTVFVNDRIRVREMIQQTIETGKRMAMEYRILRHDGSMKTVLSKTKFEKDSFGNRIGMIGTVLDVTGLRKTEQALRRSQRKLTTITDSLPVMISYIDTLYRFQFNNAMYESQFKKPRNDIKGRHISELIGESVFQEVKQYFDSAFEGNLTTYEQTIERDDGQTQIFEVRLVPDRNSEGLIVGVFSLLDDITERRALEKEVLSVAAEEQRRIGQDLHDGTGQELTGLGMIADTLVLSLSRKNAEEQHIAEKLARGIKRALGQVRSIARGLNPVDVSPEGLMSALTQMAEHVEGLYDINCRFDLVSPVNIDDNQITTQLFRIAQEATTNACKHGRANNVSISLDESDGEFVLVVSDDGIGIKASDQEHPGMGLRTMAYRAGLIGGRLRITTNSDGGSSVLCKIKVRQPNSDIQPIDPSESDPQHVVTPQHHLVE